MASPTIRPVSTTQRSGRAPGRPKADESPIALEHILEAALRAFARDGYAGVSVRTLNKELGVSHSLIHQRFGTKEDLWHAAVDHAFKGQLQAINVFDPTLTDPLDQLGLLIRAFLRYCARHPDLLLLMNTEAATDTDRLDYIFTRFIEPGIQPMERLLRHLIDEGRIRPIRARTVFFLIAHGGAAPFSLVPLARHFDEQDPLAPEEIEQQIETVAQIIITGLRLDH